MRLTTKAIQGLGFAAEAVRLSFDSESAMEEMTSSAGFDLWADDVKLLSGLIAKGDSHAKVMRFVDVYMVIEAPRYWWQEFSTYKVGTTEMSASTVHTIKRGQLTYGNFEGGERCLPAYYLNHLNWLIKQDADLLTIKRCLPESFLQKRYVKLNYQVLRHIYFDRMNHKLPEWHTFLDAVSLLPFYEEFIKVPAKKT